MKKIFLKLLILSLILSCGNFVSAKPSKNRQLKPNIQNPQIELREVVLDAETSLTKTLSLDDYIAANNGAAIAPESATAPASAPEFASAPAFAPAFAPASASAPTSASAPADLDIKPIRLEQTGIEVVKEEPKGEPKKAFLSKKGPLLNEKLRIDFDEGPIDDITFFGAYSSSISENFSDNGSSTTYNNGFIHAGFTGRMNDGKEDFKLQLNFTPQSKRTFMQNMILDAFVATNRVPHHRILFGNSLSSIGYEGGISTYALPFIARSQIARTFGGVRTFGLKVIGDYDLIEYNLGGYSSDRWMTEFFPGAEFTGWVNLKPLGKTDGKYGKLLVGGGLNAGHNNTNYTVGGANVTYEYKKFSTNFECAIADGYNGPAVSTKKASGFYSTVAYKITPKVQLLARYDQFDPNRDISGDMKREYTAGLNYFIRGQNLRLTLNYVYYQTEGKPDASRIFFGTQILL